MNSFSGNNYHSKLSMVDLVGSKRLSKDEATGDRLTEFLHINKSLSALGDVISALTAKKEYVPYGNSKLTQALADSLGGDAKTLLIVNLSPTQVDVQETLSALSFAARARNVELSLGNRDTIKRWRDMANEARKEAYEKENEVMEFTRELMLLKKSMKEADDQCLLLFNEVQKAWKVAFTLQADHKSQMGTLAEKEKMEREQNAQLRAHVSQLSKSEEHLRTQLQEQFGKVQLLNGKVKELSQQLAEAHLTRDLDTSSRANLRPARGFAHMDMEQPVENEVTRRLEEELAKRDELIGRLHEENEKLFERLTDRNDVISSPRVSFQIINVSIFDD